MPEKTVLITGGNRGIGAQTVKNLAALDYKVILACRDVNKGEAFKQQLPIEHQANIAVKQCDLSDFDSIHTLKEELFAQYSQLDVLINNAGVALVDRTTNAQGYETTFTINHLGHFLLTGLTLPLLKNADHSRIINISSNAHKSARLDFNDLMSEQHYSLYPVYCRSKLANVLFTYELTRRLKHTSITSHCVHPGMINSDIWSFNQWQYRLAYYLFRPLMLTIEQGAYCSTWLTTATTAQAQTINGLYLNPKATPIPSSKISYDQAMAEQLWQHSERLTGFTWEAI